MFWPRVRANVRRTWDRVTVASLLLVLLALVPLAHASPPDPLWIAGIYDAADYDDVVTIASGMDSTSMAMLTIEQPFSIIVGRLLHVSQVVLSREPLKSPSVRAPPSA